MRLFENAAVDAATAISGMAHPLTDAQLRTEWQKAVAKYSTAHHKKHCPFDAFLALYKGGYIHGIPAIAGYHPVLGTNAYFAVEARRILKSTPPVPYTKKALWGIVSTTQTHNGQLSVVIGLNNAGLLV